MSSSSNKKAALLREFTYAAQPLFPHKSRVVAAVSGGADSMALLHLLVQSELLQDVESRLLVAHFDHRLRADSAEDAEFVADSAKNLGLEFMTATWKERPMQGNLPELARQARYEFLTSCCASFEADRLATGHHRDDQAETFMDRLIRGSGLTGLSAMTAARPLDERLHLVRPLLGVSREAIRNWLTERGITWREDPSNRNTDYRRPLLRHRILPELSRLEPNAIQRIAAATQRIGRAQKALEWALDREWSHLMPQENDQGLSLDLEALAALPDELLALALRRCHRMVTDPDHPPGEKAVAGFIKQIRAGRREGEMRIRGLKITKKAGLVLFRAAADAPRST